MNYLQTSNAIAAIKTEATSKQHSDKTKNLIPGQKYTFHMFGTLLDGKVAAESFAKIRTFVGVTMLNGTEHVELERGNSVGYLLALSRIKDITPAQ